MNVRVVIVEAQDVSPQDVAELLNRAFPKALPPAAQAPEPLAQLPAAPAQPPPPVVDAAEARKLLVPRAKRQPRAPREPSAVTPPANGSIVKLASGYRPRAAAAPAATFKCSSCGAPWPAELDRRARCACGARWTRVAAGGQPAARASSNGDAKPAYAGRGIINPNRVGRPPDLDEEDDD